MAEMGVNDIRKAGFDKVEALASVLGCSVTALTACQQLTGNFGLRRQKQLSEIDELVDVGRGGQAGG